MVFVQKWFPVGKVFNFYYNVFSHTMKDFSAILLLELANFNAVFHVKHYRTCFSLLFRVKHCCACFSLLFHVKHCCAYFSLLFHVKHCRTYFSLLFHVKQKHPFRRGAEGEGRLESSEGTDKGVDFDVLSGPAGAEANDVAMLIV